MNHLDSYSVASVPAPLSEFSGSALLTLSGLQSKDVIGCVDKLAF